MTTKSLISEINFIALWVYIKGGKTLGISNKFRSLFFEKFNNKVN
jgi:hypothetical protein